ncbi:hypothetical protein [Legionella sp. WA2022007384]
MLEKKETYTSLKDKYMDASKKYLEYLAERIYKDFSEKSDGESKFSTDRPVKSSKGVKYDFLILLAKPENNSVTTTQNILDSCFLSSSPFYKNELLIKKFCSFLRTNKSPTLQNTDEFPKVILFDDKLFYRSKADIREIKWKKLPKSQNHPSYSIIKNAIKELKAWKTTPEITNVQHLHLLCATDSTMLSYNQVRFYTNRDNIVIPQNDISWNETVKPDLTQNKELDLTFPITYDVSDNCKVLIKKYILFKHYCMDKLEEDNIQGFKESVHQHRDKLLTNTGIAGRNLFQALFYWVKHIFFSNNSKKLIDSVLSEVISENESLIPKQ